VSEQALNRGHERFLNALRANDPDALTDTLLDDVVFYPPGEDAPRGKASVRAWYEGVLAGATTVSVEIKERRVLFDGDLGVDHGSYVWTLAPVDGGEPFTVAGHFTAIWRLGADGNWKMATDIWNGS
jgi:uncharacterized protein (TIGR02246 family)